jgi:hypothetical protein
MLPANLNRWQPGLLLLDHPYNRRFGETALPHYVCSFQWADSTSDREIFRGGEVTELCLKEGIAQSLFYPWSKEFTKAGKRRVAGGTARAATA